MKQYLEKIILCLLMTHPLMAMYPQEQSIAGKIAERELSVIKEIKEQLPVIRDNIEQLPSGKVMLKAKLNELSRAIEEFKASTRTWENIRRLWTELGQYSQPSIELPPASIIEEQMIAPAEKIPVEVKETLPAPTPEAPLPSAEEEFVKNQAKEDFFKTIASIISQADIREQQAISSQEKQSIDQHMRHQIISAVNDLLRNPLLSTEEFIIDILNTIMEAKQQVIPNNKKIMVLFAFDRLRDEIDIDAQWLEAQFDKLNPQIKTTETIIKTQYSRDKQRGISSITIKALPSFAFMYPLIRKIINDSHFTNEDKIKSLNQLMTLQQPPFQDPIFQQWVTEELKKLVIEVSSSIDMILIFCENFDNHGAVTEDLLDAIDQNIIAIVSAPIAYYLYHPQKLEIPNRMIDKFQRAQERVLNQQWRIFKNKDRRADFYIFIPPTIRESMNDLGFNGSLVPVADKSDIRHKHSGPIDLQKFQRLFDIRKLVYKRIILSGHGIGEPLVKKGEGSIAELSIDQFVNFLQILNLLNAQFLLVSSCYVGGMNYVEVQEKLQDRLKDEYETAEIFAERGKDYPIKVIDFPIVIACTTDKTVVGAQQPAYLTRFFDKLKLYFDFPAAVEAAAFEKISRQQLLIDALDLFFNASANRLLTIPSMREAGKFSRFEAVKLNSIFAITETLVRTKRDEHTMRRISNLELQIEEKRRASRIFHKRELSRSALTPEKIQEILEELRTKQSAETETMRLKIHELAHEEKRALRGLPIIELPGGILFDLSQPLPENYMGIEYILVYPSDLTGVIIRVKANAAQALGRLNYLGVPIFISKIAGNAHHFIEQLDVIETGQNFDSAINNILLRDPSTMNKAWFIAKLLLPANRTYSPLIVAKIGADSKGPFSLLLHKTVTGRYLAIIGSGSFLDPRATGIPHKIMYKELTKQQFINLCNEIYTLTRPTELALKQVAGEYQIAETSETVFNIYKNFMRKMAIEIDLVELSKAEDKQPELQKLITEFMASKKTTKRISETSSLAQTIAEF